MVQGSPTWFLSADLLSCFKLLFFRPKDLLDLERLVATAAKLDVARVRAIPNSKQRSKSVEYFGLMRWRAPGAVLGVILLAALLFSICPTATVTAPAEPQRLVQPAAVVAAREPKPSAPTTALREGKPTAVIAPVPSAPAAPAAPPEVIGKLDEVPDWEPEDIEPMDAGALHPITREGIKGALMAELSQIRECYEAWLQQDPGLGGTMNVEFTIAEIPGRERAKITEVSVAEGGMGHLAMEGCVRNVFMGMRFEATLGGETRVMYPLTFESAMAP